jgi:protein-S-isoprenylcysteine O-methyltransferase Ste14
VSIKIKTLMQLLLVTVGLSVVFVQVHPTPFTLMNMAGLALMVVGLILWVTARLQLGDSFSISAQARKLVTHGLYSKIRNPVYLFGAMALSGLVLAIGRPIFLIGLLLIVPIQIKRARAESKVLEDKFGDAYRDYRRSAWF